MEAIRVAVVTAGGMVPRFVLDALDALPGDQGIAVLDRPLPPHSRLGTGRGPGWALFAACAPGPLVRRVPVGSGRRHVDSHTSFIPEREGSWHRLPSAAVEHLSNGGFDVVLNLAVDRLLVPPSDVLPVPVFTHRIGPPDIAANSPPGFWESVHGLQAVLQTVEVAGTRPGEARVAADAETKVFAHSYRATLAEAYRHAALVLGKAVTAVTAGTVPDGEAVAAPGGATTAPTTGAVAGFLAAQFWQWARRQVYGAVVEKRWQVSTVPTPADPVAALERGELLPPPGGWHTVRPDRGYAFYADPFFSQNPPGILVEALRSTTGLGEILLVDGDDHRRVSPAGGHFSYPATVYLDGHQYVIPETASWAPPGRWQLEDGALTPLGDLDLDDGDRVLDPTLVDHEGKVYLFGNTQADGSGALHLWVADDITSTFHRHPASPVLISPRGGRMAGGILRSGDALVRFGQDFCSDYGDGVFVFRIEDLTPTAYRERLVGELRFQDRKGPHTVNVAGDLAVFDWYRDGFALLAGFRRLRVLLSGR